MDLDRRSFLQGSIASAVMAALAERGVALASLPGSAFGPAARSSTPATLTGSRTPYALTTSSVLSEDYFLTANVPIDPVNDAVAAFANPAGQIEALVVAGGVLNHLQPDPTQPSGWSYAAVPNVPSGFADGSMIAAAYDFVDFGDPTLVALIVEPDLLSGAHTAYLLNYDPSEGALGWSYSVDTASITSSDVARVGAKTDGNGSVYVYATGSDGLICVWSGDFGQFTIRDLTGTITDGIPLIGDQGDPSSGVFGLATDGTAHWYASTTSGYVGTPLGSATELVWASYGSTSSGPDLIYSFGSILGLYVGLVPSTGFIDAPDVTDVVVWNEGDASARSFALLSDGDVVIVSQLAADSPGVAIESGIAGLYGLSDVAEWPTLFVADAEFGFLSILAKDPATSTWSRTPVQQAAATALDISNWRTQFTVTDAYGAPVSGAEIVVTADRTVGVWQVGGNVVLGPAAPQTYTTDQHGHVTLALAALDLQPPNLTATLAGSSPATFTPGSDVHAFLSGTADLNGMPALSPSNPSALLGNGADGQPLSSTLNSMSPTDQTAAAGSIATTMNNTMAVASTPGPLPGGIQSYKLDLTQTPPTYAESTSSTTAATLLDDVYLTSAGSASSWWDKVKNDFHSVEHAVRKGLITVEQCAATWAEDAAQWTINLGVSIEGDIQDVASFVVTDLESAITAIHGIFHAIEVDIDRAIQWLRMALSGLFTEVEANTQLMLSWLNALPALAKAKLANAPDVTGTFFSDLKGDVASRLDDLLGTTQGAGWGLDPSSSSTGGLGGSSGFESFLHDVRHNWLLDKVFSEFSESAQQDGADATVGAAMSALTDALLAIETAALGIADAMVDALLETIDDVSDLKERGADILVTMLQTISDDVLDAAEDIVQKGLDLFDAVLDSYADLLVMPVPGLGLLAAVLDKFGVKIDTSAGHVFVLLAMFPATLIHRLANDGAPLFPTTDPQAASPLALGDSQDWGPALAYTHGSIRIMQGLIDVVADINGYLKSTAAEADPDPDDDDPLGKVPLKWTTLADAIWGGALEFVAYPGPKNPDGTTPIPWSKPFHDPTVGTLIIWKFALAGLGPVLSAGFLLGAWNKSQFYTRWAPYVVAGTFAANMGLGIASGVEKGSTPEQIVINSLEVLPRVLAPLALARYNQSEEGGPLMLKFFIDAIESIAGGAIIGENLNDP